VIITTPLRFPAPTTLPLCAVLCSAGDERPCTSCGQWPCRQVAGRAAGVPRLGGLGASASPSAPGRKRSLVMSQARGSAVCCRRRPLPDLLDHRHLPGNRPDRLPPQGERLVERPPPSRWPTSKQCRARSWRATSSASPDGGFPTCTGRVRLSDLLDSVGLRPEASALSFESYDGADTESLTLDQARLPDVLVAYRMLGAPVTTEHGGRCASTWRRCSATSPSSGSRPSASWTRSNRASGSRTATR